MTQKRLIFLQAIVSFCAGAGLVYLIRISISFFPNLRFLDDGISYGPWLEEGLKFIVVLLLIRLIDLRSIIIPFVGVGFGLIEGIGYSSFLGTRGIAILYVHFIFGLIMAFFFYLAKNPKYSSSRSIWYALALLIPVYIHLLYNIGVR